MFLPLKTKSFLHSQSAHNKAYAPTLISILNLFEMPSSLTQGRDTFHWNLTTSGSFTVDSMYHALTHSVVPVDNNKKIWMSKIPLKVKIFMWYLRKGVVLTKDNLARHNWHGSKKCSFCTHDETIKQLFFQYRFGRSTWPVIQIASNLYPPKSVANIYRH